MIVKPGDPLYDTLFNLFFPSLKRRISHGGVTYEPHCSPEGRITFVEAKPETERRR